MPGSSPEIWNVERSDAMRVIHTAYADAGARLLTTNTFGGTRPRLALHGHEDRVHELNEAGARIARDVADACGALVLGSIGPTGDLMEPLGLLSHDDAVDLFGHHVEEGALAVGEVDHVPAQRPPAAVGGRERLSKYGGDLAANAGAERRSSSTRTARGTCGHT
jgi:5-methyltetrahydrofolate--homocysteine methyltransferase